MDSKSDRKFILVMGVKGAGKNTIINLFLREYSEYFAQVLSYKTRDFRSGERPGVDYNKEDPAIFKSENADTIFLQCNNHYDNRYGTKYVDVINVLKLGKDGLSELEPEGFAKIFKKRNDLPYEIKGIFMDIPNDLMRSRMKTRGDTENEIQKALDRADFERQLAFLYSSTYGNELLQFVDASKNKEEVFKECLRILGVKSGLIQRMEDIYEKNPNTCIIPEYR